MKNIFTLQNKSNKARSGILHLPHGEVKTPVFMPVGTTGTIKACTFDDINEIGYSLILANTYHLYLRPGIKVLKHFNGLHNFSTWNGNLLTDSGGFQVFSLSDKTKVTDEGVLFSSIIDGSRHMFTPESVINFQNTVGSDIIMPLDECTVIPIDYNYANSAMKRTLQWLKQSKIQWKQNTVDNPMQEQYLFGIVQGNAYKDLRIESVKATVDMDLPGYSIGGLSVGEEKHIMLDTVELLDEYLPENKPRYLMGVGKPEDLVEGVKRGIDMFDCIFPTRVARNGSFFTKNGTKSIKNAAFTIDENPLENDCSCSICKKYSKSYIRHLFKSNEINALYFLTKHNLMFLKNLMDTMRLAIEQNSFDDFYKEFYINYNQ